MFLWQLLALGGEWDKATKHLSTLAQLDGEAQMLRSAYNEAVRGEAQRERVFAGEERAKQFAPSNWVDGVSEAIQLHARGDFDAAIARRDEAFEGAPSLSGTVDDVSFDWITNADPRFGPCVEMILGEEYVLQPLDQIKRITSPGPKDLRDLVWQPAEVLFTSGQSLNVLLPTRYPGTLAAGDPDAILARSTIWTESPMGALGCGTQLLATSQDIDIPLTALRSLVIG